MGKTYAIEGKKIDYDGIKKILKDECIICNVTEKHLKNQKCLDCPFCFNSTMNTKNKEARIRVYPGKKFKKFNLKNLKDMGKHTLYYFLEHPELNFTVPNTPTKDLLGQSQGEYDERGRIIKETGKHFVYHIHHENGLFYDDNPWNHILCLNTEHMKLENTLKNN